MSYVSAVFALFFSFQFVQAQGKPSFDDVYSLSKKSYLRQFQTMTQKEFCMSDSAFQKCFDFTERECQTAVKESLSYCAGRVRMPISINIHSHGPIFGQKLGECMGTEFYRRNKKKLSRTGECQRRNTWK